MSSLEDMRMQAKERGFKGYAKLKKEELKQLLEQNPKKKTVRFSKSEIKYYNPNK